MKTEYTEYFIEDSLWKLEGRCADLKEGDPILESFFGERVEDRKDALKFCRECPVQKRCLRAALEQGELYGVWGGRDEIEIRRDLWSNSQGEIGKRGRKPRCAWCQKNNTLVPVHSRKDTVVCTNCGFSWRSETTLQGVITSAERC